MAPGKAEDVPDARAAGHAKLVSALRAAALAVLVALWARRAARTWNYGADQVVTLANHEPTEVWDAKARDWPDDAVTLAASSIGLTYVRGFVANDEASQLLAGCDVERGRWAARRSRGDDSEGYPLARASPPEACPLLWAFFYLDKAEALKAKAPHLVGELELAWELTARAAARMGGVSPSRIEPIQLARYAEASEFPTHHDHSAYYAIGAEPLPTTERRVMTMLLFLGEPEEGGHLYFPNLDLEVVPRAGDAVFWQNVDENGLPNEDALYAELPVGRGVKVTANVWVAEEPFTAEHHAHG